MEFLSLFYNKIVFIIINIVKKVAILFINMATFTFQVAYISSSNPIDDLKDT